MRKFLYFITETYSLYRTYKMYTTFSNIKLNEATQRVIYTITVKNGKNFVFLNFIIFKSIKQLFDFFNILK